MLKIHTTPIFLALICLFLTQLSGYNKNTNVKNSTCDINSQPCLKLESARVQITFNSSQLYVEKAYSISVKTEIKIVEMYLSGENMNMGQIPIVLVKNKEGYKANLYLGLCNEPIMHWKLNIVYFDNTKEELVVTSYWNEGVYLSAQVEHP